MLRRSLLAALVAGLALVPAAQARQRLPLELPHCGHGKVTFTTRAGHDRRMIVTANRRSCRHHARHAMARFIHRSSRLAREHRCRDAGCTNGAPRRWSCHILSRARHEYTGAWGACSRRHWHVYALIAAEYD